MRTLGHVSHDLWYRLTEHGGCLITLTLSCRVFSQRGTNSFWLVFRWISSVYRAQHFVTESSAYLCTSAFFLSHTCIMHACLYLSFCVVFVCVRVFLSYCLECLIRWNKRNKMSGVFCLFIFSLLFLSDEYFTTFSERQVCKLVEKQVNEQPCYPSAPPNFPALTLITLIHIVFSSHAHAVIE